MRTLTVFFRIDIQGKSSTALFAHCEKAPPLSHIENIRQAWRETSLVRTKRCIVSTTLSIFARRVSEHFSSPLPRSFLTSSDNRRGWLLSFPPSTPATPKCSLSVVKCRGSAALSRGGVNMILHFDFYLHLVSIYSSGPMGFCQYPDNLIDFRSLLTGMLIGNASPNFMASLPTHLSSQSKIFSLIASIPSG